MGLGLGSSLAKSGLITPGIVTDNLVLKHNYSANGNIPVSDGAAYFSNTNDYINIDGLAGDLVTDAAFSFSCWFNCLETGLAGGDDEHKSIIFSGHDVSDSYANIFRLGVNINNDASPIGGIYVVDNQDNSTVHTDSSNKDTGTKYFNDAKWHHLAVTIVGGASDTTIKVYIDGIELTNYWATNGDADSNVIDPQFDNADKFSIGQEWDNSAVISDFFHGYICNVGVWSKTLTQPQIKSIMWKNYAGLTDTEKTSLVSWWNLSADANDSHGSNNGTLS